MMVALLILLLGTKKALQRDHQTLWSMSALSICSLICPVFRPPCITHGKVYNARLAPGLPNALDDGCTINLFTGSGNNFNQGSPNAPVDSCVVNLLARAEDNDNNKRSSLLKTTGLLPQRKKHGAAISTLPRIQAKMRLLALDADAGVRKQITPSPAAVAADLSSLRLNNTGPNKDDDDNNEEYTTTPAYLHRTVFSKSKQVGSQKIKLMSKYFTYLRSDAFNPHLF
jgi:hypothetical protein